MGIKQEAAKGKSAYDWSKVEGEAEIKDIESSSSNQMFICGCLLSGTEL